MPITLDRYSYIWRNFDNEFDGVVTVGSFTSIAKGVTFICGPGAAHRSAFDRHAVSNFPFDDLRWPYPDHSLSQPITIGSDVWICTRATILQGITIGHGAIVAAGAVVTKDIAPYAVVGGVPAKVIKSRFDEETIAALLRIKWWEWPDEKIQASLGLMTDVAAFVSRFDPGVASQARSPGRLDTL